MTYFIKLFFLTILILAQNLQANSFPDFNMGVVGNTSKVLFIRSAMPRKEDLKFYDQLLQRNLKPKSLLYIGHDGLDPKERPGDWRAELDFYLKTIDPKNIRAEEYMRKQKALPQLEAILSWISQRIKTNKVPIHIHCDQGQHRTGLISMVLESAFGANQDNYYHKNLESFLGSPAAVMKAKNSRFFNFEMYDKNKVLIKSAGATADPIIVNYLSHLEWKSMVPITGRKGFFKVITKARIIEIEEYREAKTKLIPIFLQSLYPPKKPVEKISTPK